MGYNREDYVRIKAEYSKKYEGARKQADDRRWAIYIKIPEVKAIDMVLSKTGMEIMQIITEGKEGAEEKIAALRRRNEKLLLERGELLTKAGYPEDYTDVQYECKKCNDSGYLDGKMCDCMKKALVLAGYESSGLGALIRKQSFDNFSLEYYKNSSIGMDNIENFVRALRNFAEGFSKETYRNHLLMGGTGLGKTHLSTAVAKAVIDRGFDVFYVSAVGMVSDFEKKRFQNGYGNDVNTERYYTADLLIIDDLGTELVNQFTLSCLYDVINERINKQKCTFINTNLSKKEIETRYNERITSRLFGEYFPIPFAGTDIRFQKRMEKR